MTFPPRRSQSRFHLVLHRSPCFCLLFLFLFGYWRLFHFFCHTLNCLFCSFFFQGPSTLHVSFPVSGRSIQGMKCISPFPFCLLARH
ncbi:hypothetical protein B0H34DRAFT_700696 [Crassisporium funariophilum]|nr:hypothetical protein B0H34DRAFT_700696 [Crassisporium funariophilum]